MEPRECGGADPAPREPTRTETPVGQDMVGDGPSHGPCGAEEGSDERRTQMGWEGKGPVRSGPLPCLVQEPSKVQVPAG